MAKRTTWVEDVQEQIRLVAKVNRPFHIESIYEMVDAMTEKRPNNKNIKETIRDTLQLIRDAGMIKQIGERGTPEAGNYIRLR